MAYTFSVRFRYNDEEYTAMISQVQDSVSVYIPDQSLHHILPLGRFYFKPGQHQNMELEQSPLENLMVNVRMAIELTGKIQAFIKQ